MLDDGWVSELELQFAGPSPREPVFDLKDDSATQWRMNLTITKEHSFQKILYTQERWKKFVG